MTTFKFKRRKDGHSATQYEVWRGTVRLGLIVGTRGAWVIAPIYHIEYPTRQAAAEFIWLRHDH